MAIYEIQEKTIKPVEETTFEDVHLREREDLQRLLRDQIGVVCPDTLVISEEFCDWEDSRQRIDLLAIDKTGNLVVIELKRTKDAGHAELQSLRYAAMVSTMTFKKAEEAYAAYLNKRGRSDNESESILSFLGWDEPDEDRFAQEVRIVLVSANFSKELTTSVMWLNERSLDIRCVRMIPYKDGNRTLVDVQQIIPLPEAEDYLTHIREKSLLAQNDRGSEPERKILRREFWRALLARATEKNHSLFANISPSPDNWITAGGGLSGVVYLYRTHQAISDINFCLDAPHGTEQMWEYLKTRKDAIETAFGEVLIWDKKEGRKSVGIRIQVEGGYRNSRTEWPQIIDKMIKKMQQLENAIAPHIEKLKEIAKDAKE